MAPVRWNGSLREGRAMTPNKGKGAAIKWLREHVSFRGGCLIWPFATANGYGMYSLDGKIDYAHRWMCEAVNGPAPSPGHQAAHSCGRGDCGCVSPSHLIWKTVSQNQLDRREHGTKNVWGGRGKLTEQLAAEIRALKGQKPQREIAAIYGISRSQVSWVMCGRVWNGKQKGVKRYGDKWGARIKVNRRHRWLGTFDTEAEARAAYAAADTAARAAATS